jgi:hypothetical protein
MLPLDAELTIMSAAMANGVTRRHAIKTTRAAPRRAAADGIPIANLSATQQVF